MIELEPLLERTRQVLVQRHGLALTGLEPQQLRAALQGAATEIGFSGSEPNEALLLAVVDHLPISETSLFRNTEVWEWLAAEVLPELVDQAMTRAHPLRLISLGCSSGAEAYGLAIKLLEAFRSRGLPLEIARERAQVLGFDLSPQRIARARSGRITAWAAQRARPDWARGFITPDLDEPGSYRVSPEVLTLCRFEQSDAFDPAGAARTSAITADLVLCQNVLVYFEPGAAQAAVIGLANSVPPGCLLLVAPVEAHLLHGSPRLETLARVGAARVRTRLPPRVEPRRPNSPVPFQRGVTPRPSHLRPPTPAPISRSPTTSTSTSTSKLKADARPEIEVLLAQAMVDASEGRAEAAIERARAACVLQPGHLLGRLILGQQLLSIDPAAGKRVLAELAADAAIRPPESLGAASDELSAGQILSAARTLLRREEH